MCIQVYKLGVMSNLAEGRLYLYPQHTNMNRGTTGANATQQPSSLDWNWLLTGTQNSRGRTQPQLNTSHSDGSMNEGLALAHSTVLRVEVNSEINPRLFQWVFLVNAIASRVPFLPLESQGDDSVHQWLDRPSECWKCTRIGEAGNKMDFPIKILPVDLNVVLTCI